MTGENDRSAPIEAIRQMLCDRLGIEQEIACAEPDAAFSRVEGNRIRKVLPGNMGVEAH